MVLFNFVSGLRPPPHQFSRYVWTKKICKIYLEGTRKRELVQKDVRFLGFESFLWEKKLKRVLRSFPRDSSTWFVGVRWLLFCLYPKSGNVHSSYCRNLQIFSEVDLEYWLVNVEKFTGRALFFWESTSSLETVWELNVWIIFQTASSSPSRNIETEQWRRWRQGRMVVRNCRRQWCQELRR